LEEANAKDFKTMMANLKPIPKFASQSEREQFVEELLAFYLQGSVLLATLRKVSNRL